MDPSSVAGAAAVVGARRLTAAQRRFKKAIQYRKKHGVSLKAAFKAVKGGAEGDEKEEPEEMGPAMGARRYRTRTARRGGASALSPAAAGGKRRKTAGRRRH